MHVDSKAPASGESAGLFDPDGTFWRVNRESILLCGAGQALLLQLAHPRVAAAVAQHSNFQKHPWRRLLRTGRAMEKIVFGTRSTARTAAQKVHAVHHRVRGRLESGTPYSAKDPELLLWVHATLIEAALTTYQAFLPPLESSERREYYEGSKTFAHLFGITDDVLPENYTAFRDYFDAMISGPALAVDTTALGLAKDLLHPHARPRPPQWALDWNELVTAGLLPATIRERYGLRWDSDRVQSWLRFRDRLRRWLPQLPSIVRVVPAAQWREFRIRSLRSPARSPNAIRDGRDRKFHSAS